MKLPITLAPPPPQSVMEENQPADGQEKDTHLERKLFLFFSIGSSEVSAPQSLFAAEREGRSVLGYCSVRALGVSEAPRLPQLLALS